MCHFMATFSFLFNPAVRNDIFSCNAFQEQPELQRQLRILRGYLNLRVCCRHQVLAGSRVSCGPSARAATSQIKKDTEYIFYIHRSVLGLSRAPGMPRDAMMSHNLLLQEELKTQFVIAGFVRLKFFFLVASNNLELCMGGTL